LDAHHVLTVARPSDLAPPEDLENACPPQIVQIIENIPKYCKIPVSRGDLPVRVTIEVISNFDFPESPNNHDMMLFLSQNTPNPNSACHDLQISCRNKSSISFTFGNASQKYASIYLTMLSAVGLRLSIVLKPTFSRTTKRGAEEDTDYSSSHASKAEAQRAKQQKADELEDLSEQYMIELLDYYKANTEAAPSKR